MINETLKVIHNRRSVRKFRDEQIKDEEIRQIAEAAIHAPNAMNQQKWHFSVVQDKKMLNTIVAITKENIMNSGIEFLIKRASSPDYHTFHHAPTAVLITGDGNSKFIEIDCGAAGQNITLAAKSLNIGSCVVAQSEFLFMS
jgi:nitroreductase